MSAPAADVPLVQRVSAVLWPSFLLAGAAAVIFFTLLDPVELLECDGAAPLDPLGAYSLGFFGFWVLAAASSAATLYFARPVHVPSAALDRDPPA